jgi:copper chaperone
MLQFEIKDMTCGHCVARITKALQATNSAARVDVDPPNRRVRVTGLEAQQALAAISSVAYTPVALTSTLDTVVISAQ